VSIQWVRLGDIASRSIEPVPVEPDRLYRTIGVFNRGRGVFERPPIMGVDTKYSAYFRLAPGQLIYSKLFAWEGSVALVPDGFDQHVASAEFPVYDLNHEAADRRYLDHVLKWDGVAGQLAGATTGMGQRRQRVNPDKFESIQFPLPDLPEQRRIAAHLDCVAESARSRHAVERMSWSLVEQLLTRSPGQSLLSAFLSECNEEVELEPATTYRRIGVFGHGRGVIDRGTFLGADTKYKSMYRVRANQVVMSRLKAFEGAVAVVPASHDGALVSKEFPTFDLAKGVDARFVRAILRSDAVTSQLKEASTGVGARRERVSASRFLAVKVPDLPAERQAGIGDLVDHVEAIGALSARAQGLRAALLPAARNEVFSSLR